MRFSNRDDAGRRLAIALKTFAGKDTLVLAIPRGGVVLGRIVADALALPLDVIITKKITPPQNDEYAIGAVGGDGVLLDGAAMRQEGLTRDALEEQIKEKQRVVRERYKRFRGKPEPPDVKGKVVLIVDDGIATGNTMKAALALARHNGAKRVIAAFPIGPAGCVDELQALADEVVCLSEEPSFAAVGEFYDDFPQVEDDEVIMLLRRKR